jgi:hypothetical protein
MNQDDYDLPTSHIATQQLVSISVLFAYEAMPYMQLVIRRPNRVTPQPPH